MHLLYATNLTGCVVSATSTAVMLSLTREKPRSHPLVNLAVAELGLAVAWLVGSTSASSIVDSAPACRAGYAVLLLFGIASNCFAATAAARLYILVRLATATRPVPPPGESAVSVPACAAPWHELDDAGRLRRLDCTLCAGAWVTAVVSAACELRFNPLGDVMHEDDCWAAIFDARSSAADVRFALFDVGLPLIGLVLIAGASAVATATLRRKHAFALMQGRVMRNSVRYLLAYALVWVPTIIGNVSKYSDWRPAVVLPAFVCWSGAANSLVYFVNSLSDSALPRRPAHEGGDAGTALYSSRWSQPRFSSFGTPCDGLFTPLNSSDAANPTESHGQLTRRELV